MEVGSFDKRQLTARFVSVAWMSDRVGWGLLRVD